MVGGRDGEGVAISPGTLFILRIAPTELVVREHIVQQTLVRKEEKQLFYTVVKTLKKNCTGTVM